MQPTPETFSHFNLYNVLHSLPDGVTLANVDGRIVFSNKAADKILGVTAATDVSADEWSEHYGTFMPDGETPFPTDAYPLLRALRGEHTRDVEMVIRNVTHADGAVISVSGRPLFGADRCTIIGAAVIFRDITALRRAQSELEATVRDLQLTQKMKDELVAFVVHDLKSPLTAITSTCDLITMDGLSDSDQTLEDVRSIKDSAWRLNRMVMDLLDIQMAEDGVLEIESTELMVDQVLRSVRNDVRRRAGPDEHRITVECDPDLSVVADPELLYRLVTNLVDNCFKYGPDDGRIWLAGAPLDGGGALITVRDEGPGVPPELRERIFEKYSLVERNNGRVKDSRGLGLRFCGVVAEAHGGRIWVEDAEPEGARFCVRLPAA